MEPTDRVTNDGAPDSNAATESARASAPAAPPASFAPTVSASAAQAPKVDLGKRAIAAIIDAVIAVAIGFIPVIGGLAAACYWLFRDGLDLEFMQKRSLGKALMKLRPVTLDGSPMTLEISAKRNWMFALGGIVSLLMFIPIIGWLLMIPVALLSIALGLFEAFKVITDDEGRRWGDDLAGTKVIEVDD